MALDGFRLISMDFDGFRRISTDFDDNDNYIFIKYFYLSLKKLCYVI